MPYVGFNDGRFALREDPGPPVTLHGQLALKHGELLDKGGMPVFSNDTRSNDSGQLGGCAAGRVVPRTLQDHGAFPGDWVLPDLADFYRSAIGRAVRVGM
ncbi:MAG: hypothetical protein ACREMW_12880 [Gemmatimonadales bacterium]